MLSKGFVLYCSWLGWLDRGCCLGISVVWLFYWVWVMILCVCLDYVCLWLVTLGLFLFGCLVAYCVTLFCLLCLDTCYWFALTYGSDWFYCLLICEFCYVLFLLLVYSGCLTCGDCYFVGIRITGALFELCCVCFCELVV